MLCAVPIGGKPVLSIENGITKGVSCHGILICSVAVAIGKFVTGEDLGITAAFDGAPTPTLGKMSAVGALMIIVAFAAAMTNFMSNVVITVVMCSVVSSVLISPASGGMVLDPRLTTILFGICAYFAFAAPPAVAHIAIVASWDWATPRDVLKSGSIMAVTTALVTWLGALRFS